MNRFAISDAYVGRTIAESNLNNYILFWFSKSNRSRLQDIDNNVLLPGMVRWLWWGEKGLWIDDEIIVHIVHSAYDQHIYKYAKTFIGRNKRSQRVEVSLKYP